MEDKTGVNSKRSDGNKHKQQEESSSKGIKRSTSSSVNPEVEWMKRLNSQTKSTEEKDVCHFERELSLKCLDDNFYVKSKCLKFQENYKQCLKFWSSVESYRLEHNIQPISVKKLSQEERNNYKREHLQKNKDLIEQNKKT